MCALSALPGLICGALLGMLLTASGERPKGPHAGSQIGRTKRPSASVDPDQIGELDLTAISKVCAKVGAPAGEQRGQHIRSGIENAGRLLPETKKLFLEFLRGAAAQYSLTGQALRKIEKRVTAVNRVVLDEELGDSGVVDDARPSEILVGPDYAVALTSDDEAVLLIGHELTHVAARGGRLRRFIRKVSFSAKLSGGVIPGKEQEEDLACEYVGVQVLKRYIGLHPTDETPAIRLGRILNGPSPAERLEIAWENFCAIYDDEATGDGEHLSTKQTMRALLGMDPELQALMREEPSAPGPPSSIHIRNFTGRWGLLPEDRRE